MQIPLNQFEQFIDESILKRGFTYFKRGYVNELEELSAGEYEAIVTGTDNYSVHLKISNGVVVEHVCSCPYDMGPVCKHVVAVLFYLQQGLLELNTKIIPLDKPPRILTNKKPKKSTIANQIDEILTKISVEELMNYVREKALKDVELRRDFFSAFAHQNSNESKAFYAKQIKSVLQKAGGRQKFIPWNKTGSVGKQIFDLVTTAKKQLTNKNYISAIYIASAVMEEMTKALDYADDSNGDIGGPITYSFDILQTIAIENNSEEIRKILLKYCIAAFESEIFSGWDWHFGVLQIAAGLVTNDKEAENVLSSMNGIKISKYEIRLAEGITFRIIQKTKGEEEAIKYIEKHLSNPDMRRQAINTAIQNEQFDKASEIANEGIMADRKDSPGLALEWYEWLLKIAQLQNNVDKVIEYARHLMINNFRNGQDYFKLLKTSVNPNHWQDFLEELIKSLNARGYWYNLDQIAKIYIHEQMWNRLIELLKKDQSLEYIESFEKDIPKEFENELTLIYGNQIKDYMKVNIGRNHYVLACKYLRRMKKLGGHKLVDEIITDFRILYSSRKALMEELDKV